MHPNIMFVPFEPWHIGVINLRPEQKNATDYSIELLGGEENYGNVFNSLAVVVGGRVLSETAIVDGVIYYSGGVYYETPYIAEAWSFVSEEFINAPNTVKKAIIERVKEGIDLCPTQRVQANTYEDFEIGKRYLERLGFQKEGVLRQYSPMGKDCAIYSITKEVSSE